MITGPEIEKQIELGRIRVDPYDPKNVGCNSLDIHLNNKLHTHSNQFERDVRRKYKLVEREFTEEGFLLQPNQLYITESIERIYTSSYSVHVSGLSSLAKHGIQLIRGSSINHPGQFRRIVLCFSAVEPVRIYPGIRIAQVWFGNLEGEIREYAGRYKDQEGIVESKFYTDFS